MINDERGKNMLLRQMLTDIVSDAFEKAGYRRDLGTVTVSDRPDLCQFQCNGAMSAAKIYKKSPLAIAAEVVSRLKDDTRFSMLEAVKPGFINLNLSDSLISKIMNDMTGDSRLKLPSMAPLTIVVDYGGPNLAKPLHVGHLRSAIIGDCLKRLARFLGHNVLGDVHLGDWGLQMGLVISEVKRLKPDLIYFDPDFTGEYPAEAPVTVEELNEIYPNASKRAKTDEAFAEEAARATFELQNGRRGYVAFWKHLRNSSVEDLKRNYQVLGVDFDYWYGESDAEPYIPKVINILKERNLLTESEGAMVVDVSLPGDREPMPPMLIVKSNGGDIYGTTDLGTLLQRMTDWHPDELWYVVDNRQALHLKQVFRCASLAGITGENTVCTHIGFGTMNGKDGKPYKTRDGGVMRLSDMIDIVTKNAYERTAQSEIVEDDIQKAGVARMVGVAAMKIGDMINHRTKDYIFDIDRFLASDGKTGPYLQYTAVRIQSVLSKASELGFHPGEILPPASDLERNLMLTLTNVSDGLLRAYYDKAPNVICETLFDIAGIFNKFYAENKILTCPDAPRRDSWLALCSLTGSMIKTLLSILGIEVPDRM
ncbi:MAG: arginine--tRNA ligase [Clostridiales bacterium]|nr:arginine--tRNA ligase [Clostridiales bacterium]